MYLLKRKTDLLPDLFEVQTKETLARNNRSNFLNEVKVQVNREFPGVVSVYNSFTAIKTYF